MNALWCGEVLDKIHNLETKDEDLEIRTVQFLDNNQECVLTGKQTVFDVIDYVVDMLDVLPENCTAMIYSSKGEFLSSIKKGQ